MSFLIDSNANCVLGRHAPRDAVPFPSFLPSVSQQFDEACKRCTGRDWRLCEWHRCSLLHHSTPVTPAVTGSPGCRCSATKNATQIANEFTTKGSLSWHLLPARTSVLFMALFAIELPPCAFCRCFATVTRSVQLGSHFEPWTPTDAHTWPHFVTVNWFLGSSICLNCLGREWSLGDAQFSCPLSFEGMCFRFWNGHFRGDPEHHVTMYSIRALNQEKFG